MSAYDFIAKFPEQGVKLCFAKFLEAFVQILLLQRSLNVPTALSVALLVHLERFSCRSCSVSRVEAAQFLVSNRLAAVTAQ